MTYTQAAVLGVVVAVLVDLLVLRTSLVRRKIFWVSYAVILPFQLLTNGVLTGRRVVVYNADDILGSSTPTFLGDGRIVYAPVEDVLFGFALILTTMALWVFWGKRESARLSCSGRTGPRQRSRPSARSPRAR